MKLLCLLLFSSLSIQSLNAQSWTPQGQGLLPVGYFILSISAIGDSVIWVTASRESAVFGSQIPATHAIIVMRSKDGGETWVTRVVDECLGRISFDIDAVDGNQAWITVQDYGSGLGRGLYKTEDSGTTWTEEFLHDAGGVFMHIFDGPNMICQNSDVLSRSSDNGESWQTALISGYGPDEFHVVVASNNMSTAVGSMLWSGTTHGNIVRLSNYGAMAEFIDTDLPDVVVQSIAFEDEVHGMLMFYNYGTDEFGLYRTFDGGDTWEVTPSLPQTIYEYTLAKIPGIQGGYITATDYYPLAAEIFWTLDFGETWISGGEIPEAHTNCVHITSPTAGWVSSGIISRENEPIVYKWNGDFLSSAHDELRPLVEFSVYPNPAQDVVYYDFRDNSTSPHWLMISDMQGQILVSIESSSKEIDISALPVGMYSLEVRTDTHRGRMKFAKVVR